MLLLFSMLSRFVIAFLPMNKVSFSCMAAVTIYSDFGAQENKKSVTVSYVSTFICHEVMGLDAMILVFLMFSFKPNFSLSSFLKRLFSSSSLSAMGWCHLHI